jgi:membrane-bound lytic murein transglycosylase D
MNASKTPYSPRFQRFSAFVALALSVTSALARATHASFDSPASWDVARETDFRSENLQRYDTPWNLLQSLLTPEQERQIFSDAENRVAEEFRKIPAELEPQVRLWLKVYTHYTSQQAIIFDEEHPEVVYEVMDFRELARTSRNRVAFEIVSRKVLKQRIQAYRVGFQELARKSKGRSLSREARQILAARRGLPHQHPATEALRALRVQWGQRDQVMSGLLSSAAFLHRMESIFQEMGVPPELILLSLVESSFNWNAVSHVGATGVWQFMPNTGREFMLLHPQGIIDERLSPIKSTVAAARLLTRNYRMLGTWPMAIGAYNHGHAKWVKLKPAQWSSLPRILAQCSQSKVPFKLGFASRNYYPEFLALLRAYKYQDVAYGTAPERKLAPVRFIKLANSATLTHLAKRHLIPESELRRLNPDIKVAGAVLPAGFWLSLPAVEDDFSGLVQAKRRMAQEMVPSKTRVAEDLRKVTPRG